MTGLSHPMKSLLANFMVAFSCFLVSASASAQSGDDIFLLQSAVAPNVVLFMDNSDSMNHIEWHPAFDPEKVPDASYCQTTGDFSPGSLDPDIVYSVGLTVNNADCDSPTRGNRERSSSYSR